MVSSSKYLNITRLSLGLLRGVLHQNLSHDLSPFVIVSESDFEVGENLVSPP